jgi:hypothetical protein
MKDAEVFKIEQNGAGKQVILRVKCPYCGDKHHHGGGRDIDNIQLGAKLSHCFGKEAKMYNLVMPSEN